MSNIKFTGVIEIIGINPYILVSKEQANQLKAGWRKPLPVLVQINGKPDKPWRINMMPVGDGSFYLYLQGTVRKASNTKVGDTVEVKLSFDSKYRGGPMDPMPEWFHSALNNNQAAKKNWEVLIPSRKKEILRYLANLKSPEAQERNVKRAIHMLSGESGRFMARDWDKGK